MSFLFDFFPILLFFIAYKLAGLYIATIVAILATVLQVSLFWAKHRRIEKMHLITLALIVVLGGATLILEKPEYIQWKTTLVSWGMGLVFLGSQYIGKKNLVKRMLEGKLAELPEIAWKRLNLSWAVFFSIMGFINLYVMYTQDLDFWVNFKFFGVLGLTFVFVLFQAWFLAKHIPNEKDD